MSVFLNGYPYIAFLSLCVYTNVLLTYALHCYTLVSIYLSIYLSICMYVCMYVGR